MYVIKNSEAFMSYKDMIPTVEGLFSRYLDFWVEVCNEESPTNYKEGVDRVGALFIREAKRLGFSVSVHEEAVSGNAVCISMNEDAVGEPIIISGHIDTVHPVGSFGTPAVKIDGNIMHGPGVIDCKGGCVAGLFAMEVLKKHGYDKRPVRLILQTDEEVGSSTSCKRTVDFMQKCSEGCIAFLNTEQIGNYDLTVGRKGIIRYEFSVVGKVAHSAVCYEGASAIAEAALKIGELEKFKDKDGITCNCGVISGGTTPNTVAEKCSFLADIRFKTARELEFIKDFAEKLANKSFIEGTRTTLTVKSHRVSMEKNERVLALAERIMKIAEDAGLHKRRLFEDNGGSDTSDMVTRGIPAIDSFGVKGGCVHSVDEYAEIDSLYESVKLLLAVCEEL